MIAYIEGEVLTCGPNYIVIKTNGIGYHVIMCKPDLEKLSPAQKTQLFIHTNVREDAFELYGFISQAQKTLFQMLISVSGVGPKLAINIASFLPQAEFVQALIQKDIAKLSSIPGIGKKTAERLSLELKDKALKLDFVPTDFYTLEVSTLTSLQQAIRNLGFTKDQFDKAILRIEAEDLNSLPLETLIKKTLNVLSGAKA